MIEAYDSVLWNIASPKQPSRLPGVTMAGFDDRGITPAELRLIPHPSVMLLLVCGGTIGMQDATGRHHQGSLAAGVGYGDVVRGLRANAYACLQLRLSPALARAALGPAAAELDGSVVTLEELLGRDGGRICEQLGELATWEERFAAVDEWLTGRCAEASRLPPELAWAWQRIVAGQGSVRIEELADELGWSRKRLWSRFRSQLGLTPKRAAKLIRFDHAVHRLVAGQDAAGVAADGGYADQSHLHRDVVEFTGLTPSNVVAEPFLAVDDLAWGWPGRGTAGRS